MFVAHNIFLSISRNDFAVRAAYKSHDYFLLKFDVIALDVRCGASNLKNWDKLKTYVSFK